MCLVVAVVVVGSCADASPESSDIPSPPSSSAVVLGADAVGPVPLGATPDTVVAELTSLFGGPSDDTDWIDGAGGIYGTCPDPVRVIAWGSLTTFHRGGPEAAEFFAYSYGFDFDEAAAGVDPRGLELTTASGVGIGSTVAELRGAEPRVELDGDAVIDVWRFAIDPGRDPHLRGQVTGLDDDDTVLFIETSTGCE
jgi:hypothetical protein